MGKSMGAMATANEGGGSASVRSVAAGSYSIVKSLQYLTAHKSADPAATKETIRPNIRTRPMSAPSVAAAARGPGVGGTKTRVAYRPAASADRKSTRLNSSHVAISYAVFGV